MVNNARADTGSEERLGGVGIVGPIRILTVPSNIEIPKGCHVWGIDPGTIYTGLTVLRAGWGSSFAASIHAHDLNDTWAVRGLSMVAALQSYLPCITTPKADGHLIIGLEMPGVYKNQGNVAVKLGDVRGLFMGLLAHSYADTRGARFHLYPNVHPAQMKKALTGYGRATKAQMLTEAQKWNSELALPDEADSIAVALVALQHFLED